MKLLKVLIRVYLARLGKDLSLPIVNQILQALGSFCFFILHLFSFRLITQKFSSLGWSSAELWILLLTFEIFTYASFFLFWKGLNHTAYDINSGSLDLKLTKPLNIKPFTLFRGGGFHNLLSVLVASFMLTMFIFQNNFNISALNILLYLILLVLSLNIAYWFSTSFLSLNFRYGRLNFTSGIMFSFQETYKYPSSAYLLIKSSFAIIVIALSSLTSVPVYVLLGKPIPTIVLITYTGFFIISLLISHYSWRFALRHYSSASS